jgi:hypothetical protein
MNQLAQIKHCITVINELLAHSCDSADYRMGMIHAFEMITFNPLIHVGIKFLSDSDTTRREYFIVTPEEFDE